MLTRPTLITMPAPTIRCSCPRPATTWSSRGTFGWRWARARSGGLRSGWIRPIPIIPSGLNTPENLEAVASKYALLAPIARDWARLAFEHPSVGFAKGRDTSDQSAVLGRWRITAQYGLWEFMGRDDGPRHPNADRPVGGAAVIQIGPEEFLVAGSEVRLHFGEVAPDGRGRYRVVEEGTFRNGRWVMKRRGNGDQLDHGINLTKPTLLKVRYGIAG